MATISGASKAEADVISALDVGVLWHRLRAAMDEAAESLIRTSFSSVIRENFDFACMLFDADCRLLAQSAVSIPSFCGTLGATLRGVLDVFPAASLEPGDVFITNDPWIGAGHGNDINLIMPVFHEAELIGYVGNVAHQTDIGGSVSPFARDLFEEGLQIPPVKLLHAGVEDIAVWRFIEANVRDPRGTVGDLRAQLAALETGRRKVLALMNERELNTLRELGTAIVSRSEQAVRRAVRELIPRGEYTGRAELDCFGEPLVIRLTLRVEDGEITCDFAGSSPQIRLPVNCVENYTRAYTVYALKCALAPEIPNNDGVMRPFAIEAPSGSLVNPRRPAPVWARHLTGHCLPTAVFDALAPVIPDRVSAESGSPLWAAYFRTETESGARFYIHFMNGGHGARQGSDGPACLSFPSNLSNTPIEEVENIVPLRVEEKALRPNSGGDGRQRGGLGQRLTFSVQAEKMGLAIRHAKTRVPARGFLGGQPGLRGVNLVNGEEVAGLSSLDLGRGDTVTFLTPGGGGLGSPDERDPELIRKDHALGLVTADAGEVDS